MNEEPIRLLLIEDNPDDVQLLRELMAEAGRVRFSLTQVDRLSAGLACLTAGGLDVVLLNLSLPDSQGLATLTRLHAQAPGVPIVVLTGLEDEALGVQLIQAGAQDYLGKGQVTSHLLRRSVRYAIERQRAETERQRAEAALRESEQRFRALIDNAADVISLVGPDGVISYASPAITRVLGYTPAEYTGLKVFDLLHPEEVQVHAALFEQLLRQPGARVTSQFRFRHKDGSWRWLEATVSNLLAEPSVQAIVVNFRDVTKRKGLEEQLRQSQKMEAIGQLAGGIAHDFNNLLMVITGYSELMLNHYFAPNDPLHKYLEEIHKAGERASTLTRQLLTFSRKQVLEPKVLNLNTVVAEMDKMLRRLIGEDIDLATALPAGLGQVKADPGQLEQVIMNLAVNARDAMPQGGKLTIETANVELDEVYVYQHIEAQPGPYVMLAVSDTGLGMDRETLSHIFEPFFTTKTPGKGTGLGLSTVYGIVKQSGGHIWVYSEIGHGTTFKVYLPRIAQAVEAVQPDHARNGHPQGSETILLVEDEERVRKLIQTLLQEEGYMVRVANSGGEALQLCQQNNGPAHLLVTDIVLPGGMNGRQLADRLIPLYPQLKVLYMSGHTDEAVVHHGVLEQSMAFLQKPFTLVALIRKVREMLDAPQ